MSAPRALVTGGCGLLGTWLVRSLLEAGEHVIVLDGALGDPGTALDLFDLTDEVEPVRGDIRDPDALEQALGGEPVDAVYHLAAQTIVGVAHRDPAGTFDSNVRGTWTVLEACRAHEIPRVLVASSDKAYGAHELLPYREYYALRGEYPYDASKSAADILARSYWHSFGVPVAVTRCANLYGGGDLHSSRLVPEVVTAALAGRAPVIRSDGSPQRDFLYVQDAAEGCRALARAIGDAGGDDARGDDVAGEAFNLGGDRPYSVAEVVTLACEVAGAQVEPDIRGRGTPPGEIDRQFLDSTRIREQTGWQPRVGLREGLQRTVDWYRSHPGVVR